MTAIYWALGILGTLHVAMFGVLIAHIRENGRVHNDLANTVASVVKAAEIYERTQTALLETIRSITSQHADMYRDLSSRFATLEERSNHHGQELRRLSTNVHDLRAETRTATNAAADMLRGEITHVANVHREDMARLQMRRHGDV